jgi:hypothetical protein
MDSFVVVGGIVKGSEQSREEEGEQGGYWGMI